MPRVLYNISTQKNAQGKYADDLRLKDEVYAILRRKPNPSLVVTLRPNYAHTLYSLGRFKEARDSIEAYVVDPRYRANKSIYTNALLTHAFILDTLGVDAQALRVTHEALSLAEESGFSEKAMKAMSLLSKLYSKRGDYHRAYTYLSGYHRLYEDHFNKSKDETINELLIRYDTEKKEHEIVLLNAENALKDAQIARTSTEKYALIIGILLTTALAFLAWRVQRVKARSNAQLRELNQQLGLALEGKNILLKEIHHRVKNNLQVISSLLKLQSQHITDASAVKAIAEGRNRVHSMALLHQNLYRDDHLRGVDMQVYFKNLIESLLDAYHIQPDAIELKTEINPLLLDVDTVIPLGLITNELISNALKHAFDDWQGAMLQVSLWEEADCLWLKVRDNGKGYDPGESDRAQSFGKRLIRSLCDRMNAEMRVVAQAGTEVLIKMKEYQKAA
jgi:two-component sensor histidine kinase